MSSPLKAPSPLSVSRHLEDLPAHACNNCSTTTTHQCSTPHPNTSTTGACPFFAFYCCEACEAQHRKEHEAECEKLEARDKFFTIARTVRECWGLVRKWTWDFDVARVRVEEEEEGNERVVCEMGEGDVFGGGVVFHEFREGLVEGLESRFGEVRDAVLTAGTSELAISCLGPLVEWLLQGTFTHPTSS